MAPTLPLELWHLTMSCGTWSRSDIRALRLANKTISQAATPLLFSTILIRPNIDSLKRAQAVSTASHLAHHVRKLHFRGDVVASDILTAADFRKRVKTWYLPGWDLRALCRTAPQYVKHYPTMIQSQAAYKHVDSFGAILALGQNLPNLSALRFGGMDEDPSSEFSRLCGFEADIGTSFDIPEQLRMCQALKPESLIIPMLEIVHFFQLPVNGILDERLFTGLQSVRHLDIRLEGLCSHLERGETAVRCFRNFWAQTINVEHLVVGGFDRSNFTYAALTSSLLGCRWSRLRKLDLVNLDVRQPELHDLLLNHRKSLEYLQLRNITFSIVLEEHSSSAGRVMKSLIFLHTNLQLRNFEIRGYIAAPVMEAFRAEDGGEVYGQLCNIQEFVCHRASFPFPKAARILGLTDPCIDIQTSGADLPSEVSETIQYSEYRECMSIHYTDSSWRWCENVDNPSDSMPDFLSDSDATATDWGAFDAGVSDEESDDSEASSSADDAGTNEASMTATLDNESGPQSI